MKGGLGDGADESGSKERIVLSSSISKPDNAVIGQLSAFVANNQPQHRRTFVPKFVAVEVSAILHDPSRYRWKATPSTALLAERRIITSSLNCSYRHHPQIPYSARHRIQSHSTIAPALANVPVRRLCRCVGVNHGDMGWSASVMIGWGIWNPEGEGQGTGGEWVVSDTGTSTSTGIT